MSNQKDEILLTNCQESNYHQQNAELDSDTEDDPGQLLDTWLGELNTLKKGLDTSPLKSMAGGCNLKSPISNSPVIKRQQQNTDLKNQYRCSLIKLEDTKDEDLDAILGELSALETQFAKEIDIQTINKPMNRKPNPIVQNIASTPLPNIQNDMNGVNSSEQYTRSNTNGLSTVQEKPKFSVPNQPTIANGNNKRSDSPDNDSAFCDNLSVFSSCSASSSSRTDQSKSSSSGVSSTNSPITEDQEARIKAEKIKLAIEKIKEASVKKIFVKVFTSPDSFKSLLIDERMSVAHVSRILAEKNFVRLDPKWTIVELIPDLYMERAYEDHENLVENCLKWKDNSKNTLWFIKREEKYDVFERPELYLLGSSSSEKDDQMEDHSRRELIDEYFSPTAVGAPEMEGFIWLKSENKKSWKKFYFFLRSSGLYYAPKGKRASKDLICLSKFDVNQVYYGTGWKRKYKAPTNFCFAIKHPQIQVKSPKYIRYMCVDTQRELHQWVTGIRIAKNGRQIYENYRAIEEEMTHADIDILTSKRYSVNSPNSLQISNGGNMINGLSGTSSPARTPSSENKSLDSGLSSGSGMDFSQKSGDFRNSIENDNRSEASSSQNTPVNTMTRVINGNHDTLRRSYSRSSKTSSSSLSETSSILQEQVGFESDYPAGGTIKKRPNVNPKIPLTNTTWGLVTRDEDEIAQSSGASSDGSGPNVRVGGGGTLLRNTTMRQNHLKNSQQSLPENSHYVRHQQVQAEVHYEQTSITSHHNGGEMDQKIYMEHSNNVSMNENMPLPPPPRDESLDQIAALCNNEPDDDDLPPPPPEIYEQVTNHYHVSSISAPSQLPSAIPSSSPLIKHNTSSPFTVTYAKPSPPALKSANSVSKGSTKKISFDENVQLIEEDPPTNSNNKNNAIYGTIRRCPLPPPNKLYMDNHNACNSQAAPPVAFLSDLQRVMNKKWQVAEKCKVDNSSPHQVLGFRDDIQHLVGQPQQYDRKDTNVGAWVLQSQQFNRHEINTPSPPPPPPQQEPTYSRNYNNQVITSEYGQTPPVVLREPTPEYNGYSQTTNNSSFVNSNPSNYSTLNYITVNNSFNKGHNKPPAPIPPPRKETTQLTTANVLS